MNTPLAASLASYRSLEIDAHVSLDDVLSKITQEMGELMESIDTDDSENTKKEAKDLLINLLSAASHLGLDLPDGRDASLRIAPTKIPQKVAEFHRLVAASRSRYSRDPAPSREDFARVLEPLISSLLHLAAGDSLEDVVGESLTKFRLRIAQYIPLVDLKESIAAYPDFPKPGILFRDISPLLREESLMRYAVYEMAKCAKDADIIAGLDARGFLFGTRVAEILDRPFVMIRKKGKLPGETVGTDYSLEYGDNSIEIQKNAIKPGQKVAIIDDLLATGGTLAAAASLVEKVGASVSALICLISLDEAFLRGQAPRQHIESTYSTHGIVHYE